MVIPPSLCSSRYSLSCCFPFLLFIFFLVSYRFLHPRDCPVWIATYVQSSLDGIFSLVFCLHLQLQFSAHLFRSVLATPIFWCNGWWESNARYWLVCVFFRYTFTFTDPSSFLSSNVSRNGMVLSLSTSCVNLMLPVGSILFEVCRPFIHFSSLYHLQRVVNIAFPQSRPKFFWCWLHRPFALGPPWRGLPQLVTLDCP